MHYNYGMRTTMFLLVILFSISVHAKKKLLISAAYLPENVEVLKNEKVPSGRDYEIFSNILKCMGRDFEIEVQPYLRHVKSFKNEKKYDGVMTVAEPIEVPFSFPTTPYITYHNGAFVKVSDFPKGIQTIDELKGKHVITFAGAKQILQGLKNKTDIFSSYVENSSQFNHNEIFMRGRVDAVFSDGHIFMAHQSRLLEEKPQFKGIKIKFYPIFKSNHFRALFKTPELAKAFNQCNLKLSSSGVLDQIEKKYINKYIESLGKDYLKYLRHSPLAGNK